MQSFRTEIENPVVEKDILDLEKKIRLFKEGKIDEEKFRSLRLARGVYGQRQPGVQMIRIKLPYGKVTIPQLFRICDVAETYSNGKLHLTTRQDVQIHYVSLDLTPELWAVLEKDDVTLREACGNTVRNVTASSLAGLDPKEPFNVLPYADALFRYFLRNPVCQEMGRKFKIAFSSSEADTAYTFMHDLGFLPAIRYEGGLEKRGFKVLMGGGLGSQPQHAETVTEFLPSEQLIPFSEAVLRVFDRYGERQRRNKARLKFLLKELGTEAFLQLVKEHQQALPHQEYPIDFEVGEYQLPDEKVAFAALPNDENFRLWKQTNVSAQKQKGFYAVTVRVSLGDIGTKTARKLGEVIKDFGRNELRLTIGQNFLIPFIRKSDLEEVYHQLKSLDLASPGADGILDITACPGTDTCNLAITSSTGITRALEQVITEEYPELINEPQLSIKISGCMNACGQHMIANIGFQGMTIKAGAQVIPALQVLLGGGNEGNGNGRFADKLLKVPAKRGPQALRFILSNFLENRQKGEAFNAYYDRQGRDYFYQFLKPLIDTTVLTPDEYLDWGHTEEYVKAIGVGECAGVTIDLVATLLTEATEKTDFAAEALAENRFADSIYHSYSALINAAKGILTFKDITTNTQQNIINLFEEHFVQSGEIALAGSFQELVDQIKTQAPRDFFAAEYLKNARSFINQIILYHQQNVKSYVA